MFAAMETSLCANPRGQRVINTLHLVYSHQWGSLSHQSCASVGVHGNSRPRAFRSIWNISLRHNLPLMLPPSGRNWCSPIRKLLLLLLFYFYKTCQNRISSCSCEPPIFKSNPLSMSYQANENWNGHLIFWPPAPEQKPRVHSPSPKRLISATPF
jgi:hypothetical protein